MIEDNYKKNVLNYMMGILPNEQGNNVPLIAQISEKNVNIEEILRQYIDDLEYFSVDFSLVRGDYILFFISTANTDPLTYIWKGSYILVLDKEYNFIQFLDSYDSGTKFFKFHICYDNESGNIYLVDSEMENTENGSVVKRNRLCILNDFTMNNFNVRLLSSFNIPNYDNHRILIHQLIKNESEGKYFLIYSYGDTISYGGALEFINNVGTENEWNFYPYNGSKQIKWYGFVKGAPKWIDSKLKFKIFCDFEVLPYNGNTIKFLVLENINNTLIETQILSLPDKVKNANQMVDCQILNNLVYVETTTGSSELINTKAIIEYNLDNNISNILYYKDDYIYYTDNEFSYHDSDDIRMFSINNILFFYRHYKYSKIDKETFKEEKIKSDLYLYQYINDKVYDFYIKDIRDVINDDYVLNIFHTFNLYTINSIFQNFILTVKQIYNFSNYNGKPYIDANSLNSNSIIIYSKNNVVFARNLYNKTLNGSATVSTVEIPNTHLNLMDITSKQLISQTNLVLQENKNALQKNIYETLFLNFINDIRIMDNNLQLQKFNNVASTYFNSSINNIDTYNNAKLYPKIRIIYQDGSLKEIGYGYDKLSDVSANLIFAIYVDYPIKQAELISNDKNIIYQTIDLSYLELNKNYRVIQKLEVL